MSFGIVSERISETRFRKPAARGDIQEVRSIRAGGKTFFLPAGCFFYGVSRAGQGR